MNEVIVRPSGEDGVFKLFDVGALRTVDSDDVMERIAFINKKRDLASKLNVRGQTALLDADIEALQKPTLDIDPMTPEEIAIWRLFLPTAYDFSYPKGHHWEGGGTYNYDRIPYPVLEKWAKLVDDKVFDRFQIWTPEEQVTPDPVLVGYIGERCYMIARWAESDANLIDISGVKRFLFSKWFGWTDRFVFLGIMFGLAAILSGAATLFGMGDLPRNMDSWLHNGLATLPYTTALALFIITMSLMHDEVPKALWAHTKSEFKRRKK